MSYKVILLKERDFFKCQRAIEKNNFKDPSVEKILVMGLDEVNPQSSRAAILLNDYYRRCEKNPAQGLSQVEFGLLIKNNLTSKNIFTCAYCEKEYDVAKVTIDHFKPQMFRGKNHYANIRLACCQCNTMKGAIHPARMPNVFNLYKEKVKEGLYSSCVKLLIEAKREFAGHDFIETKLIDKLIKTELYWREKHGKALPSEEELTVIAATA